jgi:hypothetical protein
MVGPKFRAITRAAHVAVGTTLSSHSQPPMRRRMVEKIGPKFGLSPEPPRRRRTHAAVETTVIQSLSAAHTAARSAQLGPSGVGTALPQWPAREHPRLCDKDDERQIHDGPDAGADPAGCGLRATRKGHIRAEPIRTAFAMSEFAVS